jgi:hypothetical protein
MENGTQKSPINTMKKSSCEKIGEGENRGTQNLHALRHYHLKVACLPIPPYARRHKTRGFLKRVKSKMSLF